MPRKVSILILNYNGKDLIAEYLPSVIKAAEYDGGDHEIVVVDNASTDDSVKFLRRDFPQVQVRVMAENNHLFSYNRVMRQCKTDYVIFLNNDIRVRPDFIPPLLRHFDDPKVFAVMPKVLSDKPGEQFVYRCPGRFEYGVLGTGRDEKLGGPGYTLFAHGGAAAYDRGKFLALGGLDSLYWTEYYEEVDLSYRAWMRGWVILFEPMSEVFHLARGTVDKLYTEERKRRQQKKVSMLFVLKNIADRRMLWNFFLWVGLRLGKAIATLDRPHLGAYWDTALLLPRVWKVRRETQRKRILSDQLIFHKLRSNDV